MPPTVSEVSSDLEQMSILLNHVITLSDQIGGFGDSPHLREQIQSDVRQLTSLSQKAKAAITELESVPGTDFSTVQGRFTALRDRIQNELRPVIGKLRNSQTVSHAQKEQSDAEMPLLNQSMLDSNTDLIDVIEQQVAEIVTIMREINELFSKTLSELQNQRHVLTMIEASTTNAVGEMQNGNTQLEKAAENQRRSSKCMCWSAIILMIVVTVVVLVILRRVLWTDKASLSPQPPPTEIFSDNRL
jgi:t-SNARE complex subunit (syntaxin)